MKSQDIISLLYSHLKRDEGLRTKPYRDSVDKLTIGYGRNLDDVGITEEEASILLKNDIDKTIEYVNLNIPQVSEKPWRVQLGLYNMAFNLGIAGLLKFTKMLDAIDKDDFERAADEALDSKWAAQVGIRAARIADLFKGAARE